MKKFMFVFLISIGCVCSVYAPGLAACNAKMCIGKVVRLFLNNSKLYIATDGDERALNCTAIANSFVSIPQSDPLFDQKYALLLTAVSLNKKVGIRIVESSAGCTVNYVYMDSR